MLKQVVWLALLSIAFGYLSYWSVLWVRKNISWHTYVVQSGSMEPSIRTGDVVFIQKKPSYSETETITFKDSTKRTITHRIVSVNTDSDGQEYYQTKGDANQAQDSEVIGYKQVVGKVVWVVPKLGYAIQFGRTPWGLILFFIVPTIIILYDEIRAIAREVTQSVAGRSRRH